MAETPAARRPVDDVSVDTETEVLRRPPPRPAPAEMVREWIDWFGVGRLVTTAASIVAVVLGAVWLLRAPPPPVEASIPVVTTTSSPGSTVSSGTAPAGATAVAGVVTGGPGAPPGAAGAESGAADPVVVHVAGAVARPGVYRLGPGARAVDAVTAAGGGTADAHPDAVNLAAPLADGDRLYVPHRDEVATVPPGVTPSPTAGARPSAIGVPPGPLDLNAATVDELDALPGVGPATAAAIVAHRQQHGPFASVDRLADVRGIGPSKLDALRGLVTT